MIFESIEKLDSPILGEPKYGWSHFTLGNFTGSCSYMTDVPGDVLDAVRTYRKSGIAAFGIDEEGSKFYVVITSYETFIIAEREDVAFYGFEINGDEVVDQLQKDIENNLREWAQFNSGIEDQGGDEQYYQQALEEEMERLSDKLLAASPMEDTETKIKKALSVAWNYGQIDGDHHKAWVIDQMVKCLCGSDEAYDEWIQQYESPEMDGEGYDWDPGVAP